MNIEEKNSADAIRLAGDRLFHFHACENDRGAPGSGVNIDWDDIAKALKDVGYSRRGGDRVVHPQDQEHRRGRRDLAAVRADARTRWRGTGWRSCGRC